MRDIICIIAGSRWATKEQTYRGLAMCMTSEDEKEIIFWRLAHEKELTRRQTELMRLLRTSMSADEIADEMAVERQSVHGMKNVMFHKLGVGSREEIVAMFGGKVEDEAK